MTAPIAVSREYIQGLPAVLDVPTAGRLLGLGRAATYELVRRGKFPSPVLQLGRQLRVPTVPLLAVLGIRVEEQDVPAPLAPSHDASPAHVGH